jgi:hypothetical protein
MGVVERVGVGMLRRVAAVQRSLGHIGHDDRGVLVWRLIVVGNGIEIK